MRVNKMIAAATLPAMMASPVAAANPAASLSLRGDSSESAMPAGNSAASAVQQDGLPAAAARGVPTALLLGGLAVVLIVAGAVALGSGHHDRHPASA